MDLKLDLTGCYVDLRVAMEGRYQQTAYQEMIRQRQVSASQLPKPEESTANISTVLNGVLAVDRILSDVEFPWPNPEKNMFFLNTGAEDLAGGIRFFNRAEVHVVEKLTTRLMQGGFNPSQIGIMTPYDLQRSYIEQYMQSNASPSLSSKLYQAVEVVNLEAFQEREKDIISISCVKAKWKINGRC